MLSRASLLLALSVAPLAAASVDPGSDMTVALSYYHNARYTEARTLFEKLLAQRPDDVDLNFYVGRLALWFDDNAKGVACLERAQAKAPDDARIQDALGDAYGLTAQHSGLFSKIGWAKKCRNAYERAVALDPNNVDYHWSLLGYYELAPSIVGGGMQKAYAEAALIGRLDPASGRIAMANLYVTEKDYDKAFDVFEKVLATTPDDFIALYQIGRCAALSGERLDRGKQALLRCLEIPETLGEGKPKYVNVHFRLGNILAKMGDPEEARAEYKKALEENPDFRPAKDALKN